MSNPKLTTRERDLLSSVTRMWVHGRIGTPLDWLTPADKAAARRLETKSYVTIRGGALAPVATDEQPGGGVKRASISVGADQCWATLDFYHDTERARLRCVQLAVDHSLDDVLEEPMPDHTHEAWTPSGRLVRWRDDG